MVRQLGGSFGIALISTYISRLTVQHKANIANHLSPYDPNVQQRIAGMKANFMSQGSTIDYASQQANKVMDIMVTKQAVLLTYMDIFLYIGTFFLICVPFVLMLKPSKNKVDMSQVGH